MRKFCIRSIIMGIGIGMIVTASFNFLWVESKEAALISENNVVINGGLEESIVDLKKNMDSDKKIKEDGMQEEEIVENKDDPNIDSEDSGREEAADASVVDIIISSGMNTDSIAHLLWEEGVISNPAEFIRLAHEKDYTRRFIAGRRQIKLGSSIEEILEVLIRL